MSEYKGKGIDRCRICGAEIYPCEDVEWVKTKRGHTYYVHTDCLKKEGAAKR